MGKIAVNLGAAVFGVICSPDADRWYLQFRTKETEQSGEPYTVALTLQSGLELLALLEQARQQHQLPILTPVNEVTVVPAAKDRN